jgi:hypothetical protein
MLNAVPQKLAKEYYPQQVLGQVIVSYNSGAGRKISRIDVLYLVAANAIEG